MNSLLILFFFITGLIVISLISWLSPFLPALGGAFGAIVAYFLASRNFENQERVRIDISNQEVMWNNSKALIVELEYLKRKLELINSQIDGRIAALNDPSVPDNPNTHDLDIMKKYLDQIKPHYSIKKFVIFHSIGKECGKYDPDIIKRILDIYYEMDLWYIKLGDIVDNQQYNHFISPLFRGLKGINVYTIDQVDQLLTILRNM